MMTSKAPMTPTPPPAPVDQPKDATAELAYYADKYRNTPITEQFNLLLIYTQNLAANTGDALLTTSEIAWLRRSVEHHLEDSMTTQPTDPRPAATEAARGIAVDAWSRYCTDYRCGTEEDFDAFTESVESAIAAAIAAAAPPAATEAAMSNDTKETEMQTDTHVIQIDHDCCLDYGSAVTIAKIVDDLCDKVYGAENDHADRDAARRIRAALSAAALPSGQECSACHGSGEVVADIIDGSHLYDICEQCGGTGVAPAPPSGQVCVSAIAAQRAMDAIKDSVAMMTNLRDGDVDEKLQRVFDEQYEAYEEFDAALKGADHA